MGLGFSHPAGAYPAAQPMRNVPPIVNNPVTGPGNTIGVGRPCSSSARNSGPTTGTFTATPNIRPKRWVSEIV